MRVAFERLKISTSSEALRIYLQSLHRFFKITVDTRHLFLIYEAFIVQLFIFSVTAYTLFIEFSLVMIEKILSVTTRRFFLSCTINLSLITSSFSFDSMTHMLTRCQFDIEVIRTNFLIASRFFRSVSEELYFSSDFNKNVNDCVLTSVCRHRRCQANISTSSFLLRY